MKTCAADHQVVGIIIYNKKKWNTKENSDIPLLYPKQISRELNIQFIQEKYLRFTEKLIKRTPNINKNVINKTQLDLNNGHMFLFFFMCYIYYLEGPILLSIVILPQINIYIKNIYISWWCVWPLSKKWR